jgi:hypothetical protein
MPPAPDQADQPMLGDQGRDFFELGLPTDQFRNRLRKIRHPRGGRGAAAAAVWISPRELIATPGHRPDEIAIGAKYLSEHSDLSG